MGMTIAGSSVQPVLGSHAGYPAAQAKAQPVHAWGPTSFQKAAPAGAHVLADKAHALEAAAHAQARGPGLERAPSARAAATQLVKDWAAKQADAEKAGVDLRKSTFFAKLLPTALSLLTVAAAAALTVVTAGAATPFLVIASVRSAVLIGDCACAWIDRQRASQAIPADPLPMGADFVGNLVHRLCTAAGSGDLAAKRVATGLSALAGVGLAVAGLAVGLPHEGAMLLTTIPRATTDAASGLSKLFQVHATAQTNPAFKARDEAATALLHQTKEQWAQQHSKTGAEPEFEAFCSDFADDLRAAFTDPTTPDPTPRIPHETERAIEALSSAMSRVDSSQGPVLSLPSDADAHRAGEFKALQGIGWLSPFMLAGVSALAHSGIAVGL